MARAFSGFRIPAFRSNLGRKSQGFHFNPGYQSNVGAFLGSFGRSFFFF
jgi:hypothetical protein